MQSTEKIIQDFYRNSQITNILNNTSDARSPQHLKYSDAFGFSNF